MIQERKQEHEENIREKLEYCISSRGNARVKIEYPIFIGDTEEYAAAIEKNIAYTLKIQK